MSPLFEAELEVALSAVQQAASMCQEVQAGLAPSETLGKHDKTPVTVADFAAQALICRHLELAFPDDPVIGEETSAALLEEANAPVLERVTQLVRSRVPGASREAVCGWIDRGGLREPARRAWTLDPIDGTKGFLRGEQYAVALALLIDGAPTVAVLAGPNLTLAPPSGSASPRPRSGSEGADDSDPRQVGALFHAIKGEGAWVRALTDDGPGRRLFTSEISAPAELRWCESVEPGHQERTLSASVAAALGAATPPRRIDSMLKYALVAGGEAELYFRFPRAGYREKIWDHAAGCLIATEAGGTVTDLAGAPLDFGAGAELGNEGGLVVSNGRLHELVLAAVRSAQGG